MFFEITIRSKYGPETFVRAEFHEDPEEAKCIITMLVDAIAMNDNLRQWRLEKRDKESKPGKEAYRAENADRS